MLTHVDKTRFRGQRVGVALGGDSDERDVSLRTGKAFAEALRAAGYEVETYDLPADLDRLAADRPAALLLGLHGGRGENGVLQGFLEMLEIPYSGSGVLASALAMDKARTKALLQARDIAVPRGIFVPAARLRVEDAAAYVEGFSWPVVAKLNDSGSSCGVFICDSHEALEEAVQTIAQAATTAASSGLLLEEFIAGEELTVGFFEDECLGAIRIVPAEGFYDFDAKYQSDQTQYVHVEDETLLRRLEAIGRATYDAIGCRGVARVDVLRRADELLVLEVNTIPGMTATSLVPKMAQRRGIGFQDFAELLLASATLDTPLGNDES